MLRYRIPVIPNEGSARDEVRIRCGLDSSSISISLRTILSGKLKLTNYERYQRSESAPALCEKYEKRGRAYDNIPIRQCKPLFTAINPSVSSPTKLEEIEREEDVQRTIVGKFDKVIRHATNSSSKSYDPI